MNSPSETEQPKYNFKRAAAQVVATVAFGNLILSVSTICAMPTNVIGGNKAHNISNETKASANVTFLQPEISLSEQQASWFGTMVFLVQPMGSLVSGIIQDTFGRRRCMMGVTIPQFIAWFILYFAQDVGTLFFATVVMGLSIGFMEAPAMSFLGEVIEPRYRGILSTFSEIFLLLGIMYEFAVGAIFYWRHSLLASAIVPIIAFISIYIVPESPTWLLQKGRHDEAEAALCWLRGWTRPETVKAEFLALMDSLGMKQPKERLPLGAFPPEAEKVEKITAMSQLKHVKESRVYVPILLGSGYFLICHCVSLLGLRPFLVFIFDDLKLPITAHITLVATSLLQLIGAISCSATIRLLGKRIISFISLIGCTVCCLLLSLYYYLDLQISTIPLVLFSILYLSAGYGVVPIPWVILCEIFPLDCRGVPAGLVAGWSYLSAALVLKTYVDLKNLLGMSGVLLLYGCVGIVGFFFLYFLLPETEGKTLAEVELFFNKEKRRLAQQAVHLKHTESK